MVKPVKCFICLECGYIVTADSMFQSKLSYVAENKQYNYCPRCKIHGEFKEVNSSLENVSGVQQKMTLEEAIQHCKEIVDKGPCSQCGIEHRQLGEWLSELYKIKHEYLGAILDKYLRELWSIMADDYVNSKMKFEGAIELAVLQGIISPNMVELWKYRIETCPDPNHTGGRVWCAYCGDIDVEEKE